MNWSSSSERAVLDRINNPGRRRPRWVLRIVVLLAITIAVVLLIVVPGGSPEPGFDAPSCPTYMDGEVVGPPTLDGTVCGVKF